MVGKVIFIFNVTLERYTNCSPKYLFERYLILFVADVYAKSIAGGMSKLMLIYISQLMILSGYWLETLRDVIIMLRHQTVCALRPKYKMLRYLK